MGKSLIKIKSATFDPDAPIKYEWYGVKVQFNYEREAAKNITNNMIARGFGDLLDDILTPLIDTEVTRVTKTGKQSTRIKQDKIFGYDGTIFVRMILNRDTWWVVRNSTGVTGWHGFGNDALALREEEIVNVKKAFGLYEAEIKKAIENFNGKVGDLVKIKEGHSMSGLEGYISEINESKKTLKVKLSNGIGIDASFGQIEKVDV